MVLLSEEEFVCPICAEDMDDADASMYPCPCDYQVCLWCLKRIQDDSNKCPLCRREYDPAGFRKIPRKVPPKAARAPAAPAHVSLPEAQHKIPTACRLNFSGPTPLLSASVLAAYKYLGKYGRLLSIAVFTYRGAETAFVVFAEEDAARLAVIDINKVPASVQVRPKLVPGPARHCISSLKGVPCPHEPTCPFVHFSVNRTPRTFWKKKLTATPIPQIEQIKAFIEDPAHPTLFGLAHDEIFGTEEPRLSTEEEHTDDDKKAAAKPAPGEENSFGVRKGWDTRTATAHAHPVVDPVQEDDPLFPALGAVAPGAPGAAAAAAASHKAQKPHKHPDTSTIRQAENPFQAVCSRRMEAAEPPELVVVDPPPPERPSEPRNIVLIPPPPVLQDNSLRSRSNEVPPPGFGTTAAPAPPPGFGIPRPPPSIPAMDRTKKIIDHMLTEADPFGWDAYDEGGTQWLDSLLNLHLSSKQPSFISSNDFDWRPPPPPPPPSSSAAAAAAAMIAAAVGTRPPAYQQPQMVPGLTGGSCIEHVNSRIGIDILRSVIPNAKISFVEHHRQL